MIKSRSSAKERAFHTTLHNGVSAWDPKVGCGGGGTTMAGKEWLGPRDWSPEEYGPGAKCIDSRSEEIKFMPFYSFYSLLFQSFPRCFQA